VGERGPDKADEPSASEGVGTDELLVCSLEAWDEVWRRNQFFTDILLRRNPKLRVLFVEPAADILFDLSARRLPVLPRFRDLQSDGRLHLFRPLKLLPRRLGPAADSFVLKQVLLAARMLRFSSPTLWINDVTFAPLIARTGWASLYDVTDDWLLAPLPSRAFERLRYLDGLATGKADEVVVCSEALAASRGATREVSLIPNAVDVAHFRRARPRPRDLAAAPTAVYVGSLHDARIDLELVIELAKALPHVSVVLVGPNSLSPRSRRSLGAMSNIFMLGPRPYDDVPAYLQHANVVIVPHRLSPFAESLDPIKAYECLAVDTPTVATAVAGFRAHLDVLNVVEREEFVKRVAGVVSGADSTTARAQPATWEERVCEFENALLRARARTLRQMAC
jgi:teichuronic acid biosynthesis glycosyltransferase TuaH